MTRNKKEEPLTGNDLFLIAKYIDGETDPGEKQKVEKWIASSAENNSEFQKLKKVWKLASISAGLQSWNAQKRKEEFLKKIIESQKKGSSSRIMQPGNRFGLLRESLKYAAAIIIMAGIASIFFLSKTREAEKQLHTNVSASRGSKSQIILSDGSRVWLNAGSIIKYNNGYNRKNRDLILEGEGYFEVAKNQSRPFRVHAGNLVVQATGTAFNIKAYPDENVIETTLVEGSVTVVANDNPDNIVSLLANEQANYYKSGEEALETSNFVIMKGIKPETNTSWINDQLIIHNETLESLTTKLSRKYDVVFHFDDKSLKELRYTGVLNNETIEQILEILKISSPIDYHIEKREVWLHKD